MGFYGDELFDVLAVLGFPEGTDTVRLEPGALEAAIGLRRSVTGLARRGLTVFFRRARYVISQRETGVADPPWLADLVLRADITAWFAPGAVLVPERDVIVDIEGPIVAGATRIFDETGGEGGMIVLGGDLDAVLPEWWGVGKHLDVADALQRAIDAATIRRRPVVNRIGKRLSEQLRRPLPVSLRQRYEIRRPLWCGSRAHMARSSVNEGRMRLADASAAAFGLRLIGVHTGTLRSGAIIAATDDFAPADRSPSALLVMLNSAGAEVSSVGFAGDQRAAFGAIVTLTPGQPHAIAFEDCSFTGATEVQLHLGPPQELVDAGVVVRAQRDNSNVLSIDGADRTYVSVPVEVQEGGFHPGGLDLSALRLLKCDFRVDAATPARGVVLRASNTLPLHVQRCTFSGTASAMVHIIAGSAMLDGCSFDNRASVTEHPSPRLFTAGAISVLSTGFEAPNGVDVFLSADVLTVESTWQPQRSPNGPFTELDLERGADEPASYCTAFGCSSRSGRFFGTVRPTTVWDSRFERSTLLYAIDHQPVGTLRNPARPVGVSWGWRRFAPNARLTPMEALRATVDTSNMRIQMAYDPALCVVGSQFPTGFEVFYGATQSAIFGAALGPWAEPIVWFREVLAGIRMPTSVFGRGSIIPIIPLSFLMTLALMLLGCERTQPTSADAGAADAIDAPEVIDDLVVVKLDAAPADRSMDGGAPRDVPLDLGVDAATIADAAVDAVADAATDAAGVPLTDLGPAQQMRAGCPEPTDGDPSIPAPRLVHPLSPMRVTSRRPTLRWELPEGVPGARIELCRDRCCRTVIATIDATGTSARPTEMLPPGVVFWRARGLRDGGIGRATSLIWEFGVRRRDFPVDTAWGTIKDFDGDGYDDIFASVGDRDGGGRLLIYRGGPGATVAERIERRVHGRITAMAVADFDGDGFADVFVNVGLRSSLENTCEFVRGGPRRPLEAVSLSRCDGIILAAVGDFNGDGFGDAVVRRPTDVSSIPRAITHDVVYGGPSGIGSGGATVVPDPLPSRFPNAFAHYVSPGDVDGDGYADVVFGDPLADRSAGRVWVYRGSAQGLSASAWRELLAEKRRPGDLWGASAHAVGDINADGISDFGVSRNHPMSTRVYLGSRDGPSAVATLESPEPLQESDAVRYFSQPGTVVPALTGVGRPTILIGCYLCVERIDLAQPLPNGRVYQFDWDGRTVNQNPQRTMRTGASYGSAFGLAIAEAGDIDGDGTDDIAIADTMPAPGAGLPYGYGMIRVGVGSEGGWDWRARQPLSDEDRFEYGVLGSRIAWSRTPGLSRGG